MTQEELLFQDLYARAPYGVKIHYHYSNSLGRVLDEDRELDFSDIETLKYTIENPQDSWCEISWMPYLRPMSSMTREELHEVQEILGKGVEIREDFILSVDSSINSFTYLELIAVFNWLNAHHFDYRGLLKRGLALEASEGMYN